MHLEGAEAWRYVVGWDAKAMRGGGFATAAYCKVLGTISNPFATASANETILSRMSWIDRFNGSQGAFTSLMLWFPDSLIGGLRLRFGFNRHFYPRRPKWAKNINMQQTIRENKNISNCKSQALDTYTINHPKNFLAKVNHSSFRFPIYNSSIASPYRYTSRQLGLRNAQFSPSRRGKRGFLWRKNTQMRFLYCARQVVIAAPKHNFLDGGPCQRGMPVILYWKKVLPRSPSPSRREFPLLAGWLISSFLCKVASVLSERLTKVMAIILPAFPLLQAFWFSTMHHNIHVAITNPRVVNLRTL